MSEEKPGLKAKSYRNALITRMIELKDKTNWGRRKNIFWNSK